LAGVTLTVNDLSSVEKISVTVSAYHVCELLEIVNTNTVTVEMAASTGPKKIDFQFRSVGTGSAHIVFKAEVCILFKYLQEIFGFFFSGKSRVEIFCRVLLPPQKYFLTER
jgi:hypothetical protein